MPRAAPPATADDGSSTAAAPEPSMTSVSTTTVTDPSSVNTESAGVEDAESSQGGKPTQLESGNDLTAEEEALLLRMSIFPGPTGSPWMPMTVRGCVPLSMYLDNENAFTAFFFDVSAAFESIGSHG